MKLFFAMLVLTFVASAPDFLRAQEKQIETIQNDDLSVSINPTGAELWSIVSRKNGEEYLWQGDPEHWSDRAPNMFPVNVRFKDHKFTYQGETYEMPVLGVAWKAEFEVLQTNSADTIVMQLDSNAKTLRHYPFPFRLRVTYRLKDNTLNAEYRVENTGKETMFFAMGGHPGLNTPLGASGSGRTRGDYEIHFSKPLTNDRPVITEGILQKEMIPYLRNESRLKLNDSRVTAYGMLITNNEARRIGVALSGQPPYAVVDLGNFPNVNLWSPPGKPYVCIEPMAAHHDLHDSPLAIEDKEHLISLEPGKSKDFHFSISIHPENWSSPKE